MTYIVQFFEAIVALFLSSLLVYLWARLIFAAYFRSRRDFSSPVQRFVYAKGVHDFNDVHKVSG